ncbi:MAG: UDP-3-O-(3-hydroxymyristoyl)glucosamine N-acyltransferase [Myxococcota bacterium]
MRASALAELVGGVLTGPDRDFSGVAPLDQAEPEHAAYAQMGIGDSAAGVIVGRAAVSGRTVVVVDDPKRAFLLLLEAMFPEAHPSGVQPGAVVDPTAQIGPRVTLYPGVWVGADCVIGADTILFPNVVVYPRTVIGRRCRVHAGAVLGADGFSYHPTLGGPVKVPQVGRLVIGDDVEIGANATIDRAFLRETRLGSGVKIDNLVHIGHNTTIGAGTVIAALSGISGSCEIGAGCQLGGQVGVADHSHIGAGATLGARTAAHGRLSGDQVYLGTPAMPIRVARRAMVAMRHLPSTIRLVNRLHRAVDKLVESLNSGSGTDRKERSFRG